MWVSGSQLWLWQKKAREEAIAFNIPPQEINWLLRAVAGLDGLSLRLETYKTQPRIELKMPLSELNELWQQRLCDRLPLQYLLGTTPWRQFELKVTPGVLIPRPETELIIDLVLETVETHPHLASGDWVDLGTGSGAIALGLAQALPQITVHAVDCSPEALSVAQENAQTLHLTSRIKFYQGSWWEPLEGLQGTLKGMVSNPPYIPSAEIPHLQPEVAHHEPHLALDGGIDGLNALRYLIKTAPTYLEAGGFWLVEMMVGQGAAILNLLTESGHYQTPKIRPDLTGRERFVSAFINSP
ncbi:peptide chain release factor N(5)-glutamine methyltransferase [Spirulina subsalsa FACHB-351]|uniref:Release factor glutamine methyltransferase n=1 Tax=Spirulina subsalsa FACHB-351 TaxID=234711 RepID=A0ABT3L8I9_9CYAN|nr:peptide chain release factor N(5)-glutamine methyltransferase [Spirulina subsalsa]MCW6037818.1 peptide chain release factor N(5)-glutamine methyltransferase [Spirulina subsalsa FACHB-351]